jgi:hypothetical protein
VGWDSVRSIGFVLREDASEIAVEARVVWIGRPRAVSNLKMARGPSVRF